MPRAAMPLLDSSCRRGTLQYLLGGGPATRPCSPADGREGDGMYPPTDPVYYPLYTKCCELELPLCLNAGIPGPPLPAEPQDPIHLDRVCYRFPELKLCMIHGADPWWETAIRLMLKYPNLR